jgi:hypothetical protein
MRSSYMEGLSEIFVGKDVLEDLLVVLCIGSREVL